MHFCALGLEIYLNKHAKKPSKRQDSFISSIASFSAEKSHQPCSTCSSTSYFISTIDNSSYLSNRSLLSSYSSCNCSCQQQKRAASRSFVSGRETRDTTSFSSDNRDFYESIDNHQPLVSKKKPVAVEEKKRASRSMTFDVKMASTPKSFRRRKELLINKFFNEKPATVPKSPALSTLSSSLVSTSSSSTKIEQAAHSYESLHHSERHRHIHQFINAAEMHKQCRCDAVKQTNYFIEQRVHEDNCDLHFHQHNHHHHHLYLNQVQVPVEGGHKMAARTENMALNHRSSTLKRAKKAVNVDTELTKSHLVDCNGYFKQLLKLKLKNKKLESAHVQKLKLKTTVKPLIAAVPHAHKPATLEAKSDILRIAKRQHRHRQVDDIKRHVRKLDAIRRRSVKAAERNLLAVNQNLLESSMHDMFPMNEFNQFGQFQVWWV